MLRVAVLGAGRIGKIHAANVAMNRNAKLVAVADPFGDAASSLADLLSCEILRLLVSGFVDEEVGERGGQGVDASTPPTLLVASVSPLG